MEINAGSLIPGEITAVTLDVVGFPLRADVGGNIAAPGISDVATAD